MCILIRPLAVSALQAVQVLVRWLSDIAGVTSVPPSILPTSLPPVWSYISPLVSVSYIVEFLTMRPTQSEPGQFHQR